MSDQPLWNSAMGPDMSGLTGVLWYICLVSSMVAGIDGGEGCSVGARREFISRV
jgi:hypothetical protein